MGQYELIFVVDRLQEELAFKIGNTIDAMYSEHGGTHLLTVTGDGTTALAAARDIVIQLELQFGVVVHRAYEDLVTKADIADRAGATVQAVGQWVRGVRRKGLPFPEPFNLVGGGVWLWADVNDWLRRAGKDHDDDVLHPGREDVELINEWLRTRSSGFHGRRIDLTHLGLAAGGHHGVQFTATTQFVHGVIAAGERDREVEWTRADYGMVG
ncbi:hypothetical protein AB0J55_44905 [Amycolatopsis sp. NPDC049688]|uniref:hypothetical protein n=1 Tax=Amycolatopsis sp. NPDC049688 TaxID=3154733 RepID=UPI0034313B21